MHPEIIRRSPAAVDCGMDLEPRTSPAKKWRIDECAALTVDSGSACPHPRPCHDRNGRHAAGMPMTTMLSRKWGALDRTRARHARGLWGGWPFPARLAPIINATQHVYADRNGHGGGTIQPDRERLPQIFRRRSVA